MAGSRVPGFQPKRFPPLLIMHGEADTRQPMALGQALVDQAKVLGGPVEWVTYPGRTTALPDLSKPAAQDAFKHTVTFLNKYLKGRAMNRIARSLLTPMALLAFFSSAAYAAEIQGKKITLPSTERQMHVTQFKAPGDAPRPSVLMLHGAGGFDRRLAEYNRYASALANQGMDAYLVYYYSDTDDKMMSKRRRRL